MSCIATPPISWWRWMRASGSAPGWENYLHFLLTFEQYRYDALGRRVFTQSQRLCPSTNLGVHPGADFFIECNLGYVQRTVWDGSKELYEVRMPDQAQHWEKDGFAQGDTLGVVNNNATDKIIDRDAFYGRVGYVYGGAIDKPLVMLRQDDGDWNFRTGQNSKPYRRFQPFALYPQWDLRGEPSLGTSADGGISRCEMDGSVKRCTYAMAWTQVFAPSGKQIDPLVRGWAGSLLQDKREPNGLLYRRNRYLDPATGRFTQPDPIGIAGGLNAYGYASGDPVSFSDPFGLCPIEKDGIPCAVKWGIGGSAAGATVLGIAGGVGGSFAVPVLGTVVGAEGGVAAGGLIGGFLGSTLGAARDLVSGLSTLTSKRGQDLPARGKPNGTAAKDDGAGKGQIRDYGPDGRAKTDYDFGHDHGAGDPHAHDWDWGKKPERQPGRPIRPGETPP